MVITILSITTLLAAIGAAYASRKARSRAMEDLAAAVAKSEQMLVQMRAIRTGSAGTAECASEGSLADVEDPYVAWISESGSSDDYYAATKVLLERLADDSQDARDQMLSVLSLRGAGNERSTDVGGEWLLFRDRAMASSLRATRRRDRGIPQSRELVGWSAALR